MLEPPALGAELVLLPVTEGEGVDLGELEAVEIVLARPLARLVAHPGELGVRAASHSLTSPPTRARASSASAKRSSEVELPGRLHQALVLVLAVQLHQRLAQPLQQRDRGRRVIHEDAVAPRARDLALDHEGAVGRGVARGLQHLRGGVAGRQLEQRPR